VTVRDRPPPGVTARAWLQDADVRMADAKVGNEDPCMRSDELQSGQPYAGIVISTLPQGVSEWLRRDLVSPIRRRFPSVRVEHVVSEFASTQLQLRERGHGLPSAMTSSSRC